jgi:hypothetical protein
MRRRLFYRLIPDIDDASSKTRQSDDSYKIDHHTPIKKGIFVELAPVAVIIRLGRPRVRPGLGGDIQPRYWISSKLRAVDSGESAHPRQKSIHLQLNAPLR